MKHNFNKTALALTLGSNIAPALNMPISLGTRFPAAHPGGPLVMAGESREIEILSLRERHPAALLRSATETSRYLGEGGHALVQWLRTVRMHAAVGHWRGATSEAGVAFLAGSPLEPLASTITTGEVFLHKRSGTVADIALIVELFWRWGTQRIVIPEMAAPHQLLAELGYQRVGSNTWERQPRTQN